MNLQNRVLANVYRPMKKWVRPVRRAPKAMMKHPPEMTLGRCSCAPKWLITARNNRLPVSQKTRQKVRRFYLDAQTRRRMEWQKVPISKLPSIRPTCVVEMSKCLSICVMELFMCVAVMDLEKQAKDSTKINIYKTEGRGPAIRITPTVIVHRTYRKIHFRFQKQNAFLQTGIEGALWSFSSSARAYFCSICTQ